MGFSVHRALAQSTQPGPASKSSGNPHESAVARLREVSMPKPPSDNRTTPKVEPVNLGQTKDRTDMTVMNDQSKGMNGIVQDNSR
jgi:hypothetical protein